MLLANNDCHTSPTRHTGLDPVSSAKSIAKQFRIVKSTLLTLALAILATALSITAVQSQPRMVPQVTVSSDIVRLGDLFENAGTQANIAVFRAPDPGETGRVPVADILELARTHGLRNILPPVLTHVSVSRASRAVASTDVIDLLRASFAARPDVGDAKALTITLSGADADVHFPSDAPSAMQVENLLWSAGGGAFQATLKSGSHSVDISGTAQDVVKVLVTLRDVPRETILTPQDVAVEERPRAQAGSANRLSDDIPAIGKSLRRPLRAGQIVNASDLIEPEMVKRAAMVTLVHRKGAMMLTSRGQALRSGRKGDTITIMNLTSKRTIEGVITGLDEVTVSPLPTFQANATRNR
jgi:flagellar basal body P-ring formation protein FlgA